MMSFTRSILPVRIAILSLVGSLLALMAVGQVTAQAVSGHDSDAPVSYSADKIELHDKQGRVVLSGKVDVSQKELRVRAERVIVDFTDAGTLKIQRITATGGVVVTRGNQTARGDVAIYDFSQRIITMVGNASLQRGGDTLKSKRFVIDLKTGISAAQGGRVSGTFSAPKSK